MDPVPVGKTTEGATILKAEGASVVKANGGGSEVKLGPQGGG
ncbi:MAG: hypothetical protein ABIJ20_01230 [Nanoarchaeota archaeon]